MSARYDLSSNELPHPPLPAVATAIHAAAGAGHRYPDPFGTALSGPIAAHLGVPPSHVVAGAGSVQVAQQLIRAIAGPGEQVMYASPAFEGFPLLISGHGAEPLAVPLADERHDLSAMGAALTDQTRMVIVCNPHNPTGAVLRSAELSRFLDSVPRHVVVRLDEAYREFVRDPDVPDGVVLYREHPKVVVLRTFSKAHGLAGLRVGYAVAHDELAVAVRRVSVPYGVNALAHAAALASLRAGRDVMRRCDELVGERERIGTELRRQVWRPPHFQGNFTWLRLAERTAEFAAACAAAGVAVHPFGTEGVRITVGSKQRMMHSWMWPGISAVNLQPSRL